MAIPTQPTWTVGQQVTSAGLNNIPSGVNWLYNQRPLLRVYCSASQTTSLPNQVWTPIVLDTVNYDNMSGWAYGNSVKDHYTSQTSGRYLAIATVVFAVPSPNNGSRAVRLVVNGTTEAGISSHQTAIYGTGVTITREIYLADLDFLQVQAFQDSGSTLNTSTNIASDHYETPALSLVYLGA